MALPKPLIKADDFCDASRRVSAFLLLQQDRERGFMLASFSLIFLVGILLGAVFSKLRIPGFLGMLLSGILLGPYTLDLIDPSILSMSAQLRQFALIIILIRAGLSLDLDDLKRVGRPAMLLCFIPACFEIAGMILLAPAFLKVSVLEAAIMGSVVAAVSPAVVVPRMLKLMEEGYGKEKRIPHLIMAGATVDDVFVIVIFTFFISIADGSSITGIQFVKIPVSILLGIVSGGFAGWVLSVLFRKVHIRDSSKVIIVVSFSFLLLAVEGQVEKIIPFSGLLAVMTAGMSLLHFYPVLARRLSGKFSKIWVAAEIILFVLVGAAIDINYMYSSGFKAVLLIFSVLFFRMIGVVVCLVHTKLNFRERCFCMVAYIPKATVQAAIGGIPLTMGLACGDIVLTVAVLSILITAPLGAFGIDLLYKRCIGKTKQCSQKHLEGK